MDGFLVTVIVTILMLSIGNAHADESTKDISVKIEESAKQSNVNNNTESVKHKRGIVSGYGYPIPTHGLTYQKHSPYARFPGVHRTLGGSYALTPGTASIQSYSRTYPKAIYSKSIAHPHVIYHSHPRAYYPTVYANRYPFIPRPVSVIPTPTFAAAPIPAIHPHSHAHVHPFIATNSFAIQPQIIPNVLSVSPPAPAVFSPAQVPTLISQNGWRPVIQSDTVPQLPVFPQASIPQTPIVPQVPQVPHVVPRPSISVLPPLSASGTGNTPNVNNFYLPPHHAGSAQINEYPYSNDELVHADEQFYHQQHQQQQQQQQQHHQDLHAHLQHLEQNQNYYHHSQNSEGAVVPFSEQGYETASNNGHYTGLSSYDVPLNHRGRLARRSA